MSLTSFFSEHPRSVGQTYWQHMGTALYFSASLAAALFCVTIHAFAPGFFRRTASGIISNLHRRMNLERRDHPPNNTKGERA